MEFEKLNVDQVFNGLASNLCIEHNDARFYHFCNLLEELVNIVNIFYIFSLDEFIHFLSNILNANKLLQNQISDFFYFKDTGCPLNEGDKEKIREQIETLRFCLQKATEDSIVLE